jgi:hypothetical protein
MLDPNPVTIAGSTFTFYSYYRLMQWSCSQIDTFTYLGGSKGMGGSTFKKHLIMQNSVYVEYTSVVNSGTITTVTLIPSNIPTYYEDETTPRTIANVYGAYLSFGANQKCQYRDGNKFEFSIANGWRALRIQICSTRTQEWGNSSTSFLSRLYTRSQNYQHQK